MTRDLGRLADTTFDVLVIGGGIYGAAIAWDAAQRGFTVALVDRGDFGGGASANSLKTVHGGLRSLQRAAIAEVRTFIRERRALLRIAPHLVAPLSFVVPTSRHPVRNRAVMCAALWCNDLIGRDRNDGLLPSRRLHGGRLLSRAEMARVAEDIDSTAITGGATWCDAQLLNSERLVLAFVASAQRASAIVCNYVEVERLRRRGDRVEGAAVRDVLGGARWDVRARVTINAAGAWAAQLSADALGIPPMALLPAVSRALNVVTRRRGSGPAVGATSRGRFFFRVPWRGRVMFGTSHDPFRGSAEAARPPRDAVGALLADINRAFPRAPVSEDEVSLVHFGLLPAESIDGSDVVLTKRSVVRDHRSDGVGGFITVIGVRYTTARQTAEEAVDLAAAALDRGGVPCRTATTPLEGGDIADLDLLRRGVEEACVAGWPDPARLTRSYGADVGRILGVLADPVSRRPLGTDCDVTRGEIFHAVRFEMAQTLSDAVLRRTEAGSAGHPGRDALDAAADVMGQALGWDPARRADEVADVERHYELASGSADVAGSR